MSAAAAAPMSQPSPAKACFNAFCKEPKTDGPRRRGWRLRSGDYAELCDRCYCAYDQGNFCETFHAEVAGWRSCEACGKRVHCGCIVSVYSYVLLDAGGVDCVACSGKYLGMTRNQMWAPPSSSHHPLPHHQPHQQQQHAQQQSEQQQRKLTWRGPPSGHSFPGHWRQPGSSLWAHSSSQQSDLQQRLAFEFDRPSAADKFYRKFDDAAGPTTPSPGPAYSYSYSIYHRDSNPNPTNPNPNPSPNGLQHDPAGLDQSVFKEENGSLGLPVRGGPSPASASPNMKQYYTNNSSSSSNNNSNNNMDSGGEMRNGRPRMDVRARSQLLPRYWPRITDQELQKISGDSNSVITPLFEKMLSASDAGRIGRLVLPKKCAEAYFPAISQPEGLPLKVQDASGKEWLFQFRFWPNNNSRMYVLEGVTPCIQAMQLQAGDTVTFSRIDPEGKLVMGFRKAANSSSGEQETQHLKSGNGFLTPHDPTNINNNNNNSNNNNNNNNNNNINNIINNNTPNKNPNGEIKEEPEKGNLGFIQKEVGPVKRKGSSVGSKIKRLRIETEDSIELKITWEEAQSLLRPPPNQSPNVVLIDGHEFEEYEEPPVLGRKTYFLTNQTGESEQWVQCEDCFKWRKIPVDALLPARWTCSDNSSDPDRSSCLAPSELSLEQLAELIPTKPGTGGMKRSKVKAEASADMAIDLTDGLDTLANLAILGETAGRGGPSSSTSAHPSPSPANQQTTRHPRHRPGCSCIVCIQPPSGKGPKHKQSCTCNVCLTVRRRFRTLMLRRGEKKQQVEKSAEPPKRAPQPPPLPAGRPAGPAHRPEAPAVPAAAPAASANESSDQRKITVLPSSASSSPLKAQIDLNMQPDKEEEISPKSSNSAVAAIRLLQDAPT